jgi:hypothetical protein
MLLGKAILSGIVRLMKQVIESGDCLMQLGLDFDINNGTSKGKYVVTEYQLDICSTTYTEKT